MHQASFKTFGKLISGLDQCNATKTKINLISEFIKNIDPRDGSWILVLLMGNQKKRLLILLKDRLIQSFPSHLKI